MNAAGGVRPLVSVVIPTYDHADLVGETIASVQAQTYRPLEIVVVEDGSPDPATGAVLAPLAAAGVIRHLTQENLGQAAARNRGLAEARGPLVAFLDDDDLWPADKLAWQVDLLRDPEVVLAYGDFVRLLPDGSRRPARQSPLPDGHVHDAFRLRNWLMSPGQALMRTAAVRAIGGFDERIWGSDDWDLYLRLARRGVFRWRHREALVYRVHAQAASRRAVLHARNHLRVVRRHLGWNLPLVLRHQRLAAGYFVPNLQRYAAERQRAGNGAAARRAHLMALLFRPELALRRTFVGALARTFTGGGRSRESPPGG